MSMAALRDAAQGGTEHEPRDRAAQSGHERLRACGGPGGASPERDLQPAPGVAERPGDEDSVAGPGARPGRCPTGRAAPVHLDAHREGAGCGVDGGDCDPERPGQRFESRAERGEPSRVEVARNRDHRDRLRRGRSHRGEIAQVDREALCSRHRGRACRSESAPPRRGCRWRPPCARRQRPPA